MIKVYPEHQGISIPEIFICSIFKFKNAGEYFEDFKIQVQQTEWGY